VEKVRQENVRKRSEKTVEKARQEIEREGTKKDR
jgi:hypothetical protein